MIRSAVLVSGKGTKLQSLLDSVFFGEIPELQLVAVISSDAGAYALKRARNAGIETVVVEPSVFPNDTSYDMAIRNKLKDMDIELVINAGFYPGIGRETAKSFRGKVIAVQPSLVPAFETLRGDAVHEAVLARGLKVTGATAYLADENGGIGPVLLQKAVPVLADDDLTTLKRRVLTDAEWKLLCDGLNKLGKIAADRGFKLCFHHHMGTVVQTSEETDRMMANTDPRYVFLCYDTGHFTFAGEDPLAMLKKYVDRVGHVHLKDMRLPVVEEARKNDWSFLQAVRLAAFTVPGDGDVDFDPVFKVLADAGYQGWLLVEAEQDPAKANPLEYAMKARKYIREHTGL